MKRTSAGKQRKVSAARVLSGLLLGAYLAAGYCMPVEAMFFSNALCYAFPPSEEDFQKAKAQGWHIAVNTAHDVPDFMQDDPDVQKVELDLWADF